MAEEKSGWRNWGDHPYIVTLATIGVLIGSITSIMTLWQSSNSNKSDSVQTAGLLLSNQPANNNTNTNIQTETRTVGPEKGKVVTIRGIKDGYLNLREQPSIDSAVIESAYNDDKVIVLEFGEQWSKVRFKGKIGYMYSEYLVRK